LKTGDDFMTFVEQDIVIPEKPASPIFNPSSSFISIGSCFSTNVAKALERLEYDITNFFMSERLFTTFALRDFLQGVSNGAVDPDLIDDFPENEMAVADIDRRLTEGSTIILTLGLSMCWFHRVTGAFHHSINSRPEGDARTGGPEARKQRMLEYEMRPTSLEDNVEALREAIMAIKAKNADNKIVLSVSPIPLMWMQSDEIPLIRADIMSKMTLYQAARQLLSEGIENLYYFPSFEIVRWASPHVIGQVWGSDRTDGDARHLDPEFVKMILFMFFTHFGDTPDDVIDKL